MTEFVASASRPQEDQQMKTIPLSPMPTSMGFPFAAAGSASDIVAKLNAQLIQVKMSLNRACSTRVGSHRKYQTREEFFSSDHFPCHL
jgi:hypothetical protein